MGKSNLFTGQPIFSQLLKLIPITLVHDVAREHGSNRYYKVFKAHNHLVRMLYASFLGCTSLREITTGLQANAGRLGHLRLISAPRRSTLSDANRDRDASFFEDLFHRLYNLHFLPDSRFQLRGEEKRLFLIDSTTISLFSDIMKGAGMASASGKKKGGVKAHMVVDSRHDLPCFIFITEAKENDRAIFPKVQLPKNSVVVFDKGYINYHQFQTWTKDEVTWVTRLNKGSAFEELISHPVDSNAMEQGILSDKRVKLGRPSNSKKSPVIEARIVEFFDKEKNRVFHFITNDHESDALQITQLYKQRWQIEILFKRIKQRYPLRYFLGENPNAIKIQIWAAMICDLLVKIIQQKVNGIGKRMWSYANISAMIKHHLMTYIKLIDFLMNPEKALHNYHPPNNQTYLNF